MTGGYKIIDLYGLDLANIQLDSSKIEKIFSDIESTYKTKALLFDNYKINDIEQNATFSSAVVKNSGFEIALGDYKILIKTDSIVDNTLHLYRHDLYGSFVNINGGDNANGVISLYTTSGEHITPTNLKDFIRADNQYGVIMTGSNMQKTIMSIYYNSNNQYEICFTDDESLYSVKIAILKDSITKIF